MKLVRPGIVLLLLLCVIRVEGQSLGSFRTLTRDLHAKQLPAPQHLQDYVVEGKLRLSLRDAILLTLENNSTVRVDETAIAAQKFLTLAQYAPFDPLLQAVGNVNRYSYPGYSQLQGVGESSASTLDSLSQTGLVSYTQTFSTGTQVLGSVSSGKNSTNSEFYYYNPYFNSVVNFQITQPLLRGAGRFANRAPILIAQRGIEQSKATFRAAVSDAILQTVQQYWMAVQARGNLEVSRASVKLAEESYARDQHALQLGALPPLDIYRSQSELATRRVAAIQAETAVTQAEDALRLTVGANQDGSVARLPLELTEKPEDNAQTAPADAEALLKKALAQRPELAAESAALEADRLNIRLAHNQMLPLLTLQGFYESTGLGGNQYDLNTGKLISTGGFNSSFGQVFGFGYPGYGAVLNFSFPIKNHQAQANLGNALVSQRHDLYAQRQARESIAREVNDAVAQVDQAWRAMDAAKSSLTLAQQLLSADQRKYELGAETNFFVLDSQSRLAQTQLIMLQAQVNYAVARATLDHATGDMLEPFEVQIRELGK
jgi:outer membrane protein TolC